MDLLESKHEAISGTRNSWPGTTSDSRLKTPLVRLEPTTLTLFNSGTSVQMRFLKNQYDSMFESHAHAACLSDDPHPNQRLSIRTAAVKLILSFEKINLSQCLTRPALHRKP